ncbi:hypothetical protein D4R86_03035 [bacterium]|nr:MAG: hypothetical protein D4R86_03035 [bacterium]
MSKRLGFSIGSKKEDEDIRDEILKLINDRKNLNCTKIYISAESDEMVEDKTGIRFINFWIQSSYSGAAWFSFLVKECAKLFAQGNYKNYFLKIVKRYTKHENLMERYKDIRIKQKKDVKKGIKINKLKEKLMPKYKPLEKDV